MLLLTFTKGTELITFVRTCKRKIPYYLFQYIRKTQCKSITKYIIEVFAKSNFPTTVKPLPMPPLPQSTYMSTYMGASTPVHTVQGRVTVLTSSLFLMQSTLASQELHQYRHPEKNYCSYYGVMSTFIRSHWSFLLVIFLLLVKWKGS